MVIPTIDLKIFAPKYRQAFLYAMIEGLNKGSTFSFSDDRDPNEIELELESAGLNGYRWIRADTLLPTVILRILSSANQCQLTKKKAAATVSVRSPKNNLK